MYTEFSTSSGLSKTSNRSPPPSTTHGDDEEEDEAARASSSRSSSRSSSPTPPSSSSSSSAIAAAAADLGPPSDAFTNCFMVVRKRNRDASLTVNTCSVQSTAISFPLPPPPPARGEAPE